MRRCIYTVACHQQPPFRPADNLLNVGRRPALHQGVDVSVQTVRITIDDPCMESSAGLLHGQALIGTQARSPRMIRSAFKLFSCDPAGQANYSVDVKPPGQVSAQFPSASSVALGP